LFPAPGQEDATFWRKVDFVSTRANFFEKWPDCLIPFDVNPYWVPIQTERQGLQFWEGAVLWLEGTDADFTMPRIQVSDKAQRFYTRDELIAHEMVHAVRSDFVEEQFEEVLAYATSTKAWRRWLGPFFRKPVEASVFLWAMLLTVAVQVIEVATEWTSGWLFFPWIPFFLIAGGAIRLYCTQRLFRGCLKNLGLVLQNPEKKWAVALRMSDEEIRLFARLMSHEIREWIEQEKAVSLRWKMIAQVYFSSADQKN
jgi:hypothetical protein